MDLLKESKTYNIDNKKEIKKIEVEEINNNKYMAIVNGVKHNIYAPNYKTALERAEELI